MNKLTIHSQHYDIIQEALKDLLEYEELRLSKTEDEEMKTALIRKTTNIENLIYDTKYQYENEI